MMCRFCGGELDSACKCYCNDALAARNLPPSMVQGWQCPVCMRVNAPSVTACPHGTTTSTAGAL